MRPYIITLMDFYSGFESYESGKEFCFMEKNELFTIKPSLRQYYGRTVTKDLEFDERTENGVVHQMLKDLILTTEINRESEFSGIKSTEKSVLTQELPEGTILIWDESLGYILPDREVYKLENLKEEITQIEKIYKDVNKNDLKRK